MSERDPIHFALIAQLYLENTRQSQFSKNVVCLQHFVEGLGALNVFPVLVPWSVNNEVEEHIVRIFAKKNNIENADLMKVSISHNQVVINSVSLTTTSNNIDELYDALCEHISQPNVRRAIKRVASCSIK